MAGGFPKLKSNCSCHLQHDTLLLGNKFPTFRSIWVCLIPEMKAP